MNQSVLKLFPWPWLPSLGLLIFFVFFVGLLVRVLSKSRRSVYHSAEALPLNDGKKL
jgi:cytochrome c oxidase cbb3-type subunit 4